MMKTSDSSTASVPGGCLCGKLRYKITGPQRHIIVCHCENCRRSHGHVAAYTCVEKKDIEIQQTDECLRWYHDKSADTFRGFCADCGSSLFWDANDGGDKLSVSAGSLDDSADLTTIGHIYAGEKGGYYEISSGLPVFVKGSDGALG
jgi:hypothetical protein